MVNATPSVVSDSKVCKCGNSIKITGDRCDDCFVAGLRTPVGSGRHGMVYGSERSDRFRAGVTPGDVSRVNAVEPMYQLNCELFV